MMIALCVVGLIWAAGLVIGISGVICAPEGEEDNDGFREIHPHSEKHNSILFSSSHLK